MLSIEFIQITSVPVYIEYKLQVHIVLKGLLRTALNKSVPYKFKAIQTSTYVVCMSFYVMIINAAHVHYISINIKIQTFLSIEKSYIH